MVYVFLANGFEEVEAIAPIDLMRRAGVDVTTVGIGSEYITGSHSVVVRCDTRDDEVVLEDIEAVVLPGGMPGATNLDASATVDRALKLAFEKGAILAAICAAPLVLGKRGYLAGKKATCFPGFESYLEGATLKGARVVRDGCVITAIGMGAASEFGLELVSALKGESTARQLAVSSLTAAGFGE